MRPGSAIGSMAMISPPLMEETKTTRGWPSRAHAAPATLR
jgi:hypothetical protein